MTFTTRPTLQGTFGMVSSTHWLASQSAMGILEAGGNAFDAAVAAGFLLHVVEPHLNGPGGEVPAILATADDPTPTVLSGQGPAPSGATPEHYRSLGLDLIPGSGPIAAAVPGAVDAWLVLLRDHGTRRLADVLSYAIGYARDGHPFLPRAADLVVSMTDLFTSHWPTSAALWLRDGHPPGHWARFRNPEYAAVLERLVTEGEASGAGREATVVRRFRDVEVVKTGTWGQGPVLLQSLAMLDGLDDALLDPGTADGAHTVAEVLKLALADREAWYGDVPGVPLEALLSEEYASRRLALVGPEASRELRPGSPDGREPRLASHVLAARSVDVPAGLGEPTVTVASGQTRGDTCHVDVIDRWGNLVSATPSGGWLQSSPAVPGLGFCLGSRMQMFWLDDGLPSTVAPGKRPRTTLSPTLVLRDGRPVMACGTPGGDQQDQWQLLFLLRHLVGGAELQAAIDAPTWHTTSCPGSFYPREMAPGGLVVEDRLGKGVITELSRRGHDVTRAGPWSLGRMCAVAVDPHTGMLSAAANPRGAQGYAVGR